MIDINQITQLADQINSKAIPLVLQSARLNAIQGCLWDIFGIACIIGLFCLASWLDKVKQRASEKEWNQRSTLEDAIEEVPFAFGARCLAVVIIILMLGSIFSIFYDFYGISHPAAYIAYQAVSRIAGN